MVSRGGKLMAPRKPTQSQLDGGSQVVQFVERLGLPTFLLIAAAYFVFTTVIEPLATAYRESIMQIAASAKALEESVENNTRLGIENSTRLNNEIRAKLLEAVGDLDRKVDAALSKLEQRRD